MSDWDDAQKEINSSSGAGFYKPKDIPAGKSEIITITRYSKNTETKYPIRNKDGSSLGYTWRFFLADGRTWDVSNNNRKVIMAGLHPDGKTLKACRFKVTNRGSYTNKQSQYLVEPVGSEATVENTENVPF